MKKLNLLILYVVLAGFFAGCNSTKSSVATGNYKMINERYRFDKLPANHDDSAHKNETKERKIIYSSFLSLVVEKPDSTNVQIEKIAKKYGGYVNEIGTYRTIIRVKSTHLDDAIKDISALGKLKSKNMSGQDVTEEYWDYQIRLDNAEKARKKYLELLAKAENVEAAIKVEKELERLNETIDLLKGKMNRITHLSDFSTITVNLKERKKPGLIGYIGIGLYHAVKWLFVRN